MFLLENIIGIFFLDSLRFCQGNKGLEIYAWCIMSNHVHLIIGTSQMPMQYILRDLKKYTSVKIIEAINENQQESRKEWLLWMFERAGKKNSNNTNYQFWQQDNHPIELSNNEMMIQKLNYIHQNPVEEGIVLSSEAYLYSSAKNYAGMKDYLIEILYID